MFTKEADVYLVNCILSHKDTIHLFLKMSNTV